MTDRKQTCIPTPRLVCPGGCLPGQCINASCPNRRFDVTVLGRPDIEEQAKFRKYCYERAKAEREKIERMEFLKESRRKMGMESFYNPDVNIGKKKSPMPLQCADIDDHYLQTPDVKVKTMRDPARPSCMLETPNFTPPSDDYNDLSRFLRISTMPGYNTNEQVSEYHDNHNMAVWNKRMEIDPQVYKMKRDWLSVWGEFNVKEQCWRKAWAEKFGAN